MKPDQIYDELKNLAEKLDMTVSEQNFSVTGIKVNSGLCKVKGKSIYYIDKHKSLHKKNQMLAECLSEFSYEDIYIMPAIREYLDKIKKKYEKNKNME